MTAMNTAHKKREPEMELAACIPATTNDKAGKDQHGGRLERAFHIFIHLVFDFQF